jgi:hypothetical protein
VTNLERSQAKASQLVKSGKFHGWSPIAFELRFEDGFEEARASWSRQTASLAG